MGANVQQVAISVDWFVGDEVCYSLRQEKFDGLKSNEEQKIFWFRCVCVCVWSLCAVFLFSRFIPFLLESKQSDKNL